MTVGRTSPGYKIEVSNNGTNWSNLVADTGSNITGYSHTSLTAGSTRHYQVSAINSVGTGTASNVDSAITTQGVTGSPDLDVYNSNLRANLPPSYQWSPNATVRNQGDAASPSTTLRFYRSTDSTITTNDTEVGTKAVGTLNPSGSTAFAIGLNVPSEPGKYYYGACVDAVAGESDVSNNCSTATEVTVRIVNAPPQVVGDIDDITVALGESFIVDVSVVFRDPDGEEVGNYGFAISTQGVITGTVNTQTGILSLRAANIGETMVSVDAADVHGNTVVSDNLFKITVVAVETASGPAASTGLTATANGQTTIDLSWTAPSDDGGADITGYRIEVSTNGTSWTDLVADTNSTNTNYSHTGLTAGSTRHYRVSAINSEGTGTASGTDSATTDAAATPDVVLSDPSVTDITPDAGNSFIVNITVENEGTANSQPTMLHFYRSTDSTITTGDTLLETISVPLLGPGGGFVGSTSPVAPSTPGIYYYGACVDTVPNESNTANNCSSGVAVTVSAAAAPGAPTGLSATADGQTEIDLSWSAPSDDGGENITGYKIEVSTNGSSWSDLVANTNSAATTYPHRGLTARSTRHYRVSAINSVGTGAASGTDSATTDAAPAPAPEPAEDGFTLTLSLCSAERASQHVDLFDITITGTISANRRVTNVLIQGFVDGTIVDVETIGSIEAGASETFELTGTVLVDSETVSCEVEVQGWTDG